jgi:hypothetical protein
MDVSRHIFVFRYIHIKTGISDGRKYIENWDRIHCIQKFVPSHLNNALPRKPWRVNANIRQYRLETTPNQYHHSEF